MKIIKKDGTEVKYDREKIKLAIEKANSECASQSIVDRIVDSVINDLTENVAELVKVNCENFIGKSRKWMKSQLQECKYMICRSKLLKLLCKFAYDVAVGVIASLISTLILTAILIKSINQSFFVRYI